MPEFRVLTLLLPIPNSTLYKIDSGPRMIRPFDPTLAPSQGTGRERRPIKASSSIKPQFTGQIPASLLDNGLNLPILPARR